MKVMRHNIRPPLDKKLFPVHRPTGLKRADWNLFSYFLKNAFFPSYFLYLINITLNMEKNPALSTGFVFSGTRWRGIDFFFFFFFFYLRVALLW